MNRYKQSVIQSESLEKLLTEYPQGTFTQWVTDNVDHNIATLSGEGTFHGMGIIAVSTSKDKTHLVKKSRVISRQQRIKVSELVNDKGVSIIQSTREGPSLNDLQAHTSSANSTHFATGAVF